MATTDTIAIFLWNFPSNKGLVGPGHIKSSGSDGSILIQQDLNGKYRLAQILVVLRIVGSLGEYAAFVARKYGKNKITILMMKLI